MSATAFQRMRREQAARAAKVDVEQTVVSKPLDKMTVAELKEHASAKGIDLGEATKKDDILAAIKAAEAAEAESAAVEELTALRNKAAELGIEDIDGKDTETLRTEIAEKGGAVDGDNDQ